MFPVINASAGKTNDFTRFFFSLSLFFFLFFFIRPDSIPSLQRWQSTRIQRKNSIPSLRTTTFKENTMRNNRGITIAVIVHRRRYQHLQNDCNALSTYQSYEQYQCSEHSRNNIANVWEIEFFLLCLFSLSSVFFFFCHVESMILIHHLFVLWTKKKTRTQIEVWLNCRNNRQLYHKYVYNNHVCNPSR